MFIAKGLLVKGLAGLTAFVGAGGAIAYRKEIKDYFSSKGTSVSPKSDINTKITETLKLPEDCKFTDSESANPKECTLDEAKLKVVKFVNKQEDADLTFDGTPSNLKLSIKKLQESDKARYGDDIIVGDPWFTFKDFSNDITIKGVTGKDITLKTNTNPEFKINSENKLEKAWTVTTLAEKVGLTCPATEGSGDSGNKCTVESGKQINYKNNDSIQQLTTSSQVTDGITYEEDQENYNQGFKFTVSAAVSGNDNASLPVGYYEIKYEGGESKGWYLFKKGDITQAGGGDNGAGSPGGGSQQNADQGTNSANTEINNKITGTLKLPEDCKFTDSDTTNPKECSLDETKLKAIEFKDKDGDLTIEGSVSGLKLSIKKLQESDKQQYGNDITVGDPWFTFKDFTENIKVKKNETAIVSLIKGTNPEFKINDNKLEKAWTVTTLGEKVNLKCSATEGSADKKCTIEANKTVKFSENGTDFKDFTSSTTAIENQITYEEDKEGYNQGFKFNVSTEVTGTENGEKLPQGDYEIKYDSTNSWYFLKKTNVAA